MAMPVFDREVYKKAVETVEWYLRGEVTFGAAIDYIQDESGDLEAAKLAFRHAVADHIFNAVPMTSLGLSEVNNKSVYRRNLENQFEWLVSITDRLGRNISSDYIGTHTKSLLDYLVGLLVQFGSSKGEFVNLLSRCGVDPDFKTRLDGFIAGVTRMVELVKGVCCA